MLDRLSRIEAHLRSVDDAIAELSRRVSALEAAETRAPTTTPDVAHPAQPAPAPLPASVPDVVGVLTLIGRTLMVFGGAYLLRAITDTGRVPPSGGVLLGLAYAVVWFGAADWAARARRPLSSLFHGVAAVLISLPLIGEASTRFHVLTPEASASTIVALTALALGLAWRRRLPSLAAVAIAGAIVTTFALSAATDHMLPFAAALVVVAVVTMWQSYALEWPWLRWPAGLAADVLLLGLMTRAAAAQPLEPPAAAMALHVLLFVIVAGSCATRLLARPERAGVFEFVQMAAVIGVGLIAATIIAAAHWPEMVWIIGALAAIAGAAGYVTAFALVRPREGPTANFYFFSTAALALVVTGASGLPGAGSFALALVAYAVIAIAFASREGDPTAWLHGAIFTAAAALTSGLLSVATVVWFTQPSQWLAYSAAAWLALAVAVATMALPRTASAGPIAGLERVARGLFAGIVVVGAGAALVLAIGPWIAGAPPRVGVLASLKTVVLAGAAVGLARLTRVPRLAEFGWLAYPVLAFGAIKLFVEDFWYSQPATLFFALALYGAALIAVPRLAKRA